MTEVRTRDDALTAIDRGLTQWVTAATGVLVQASAVASGASATAAAEVRKWATKAAALEARISALKEGEDPRPLNDELARVSRSLQSARAAASRIEAIGRQVSALQRSYTQRSCEVVNGARADLSRRAGELGVYWAGAGRSGDVGPATSSSTSGSMDNSVLARAGLDEIAVGSATFDDNPIIDGFGRGGMTRADYRWAVQTWDEVVGPGVSRGMTREDFERRDVDRAAAPLRRTAAVYDMFLGDSDRIRVGRRPDGTFDVTNGRHRLQIARELGIRTLPGEIIGS